jgi:hypothetical protein
MGIMTATPARLCGRRVGKVPDSERGQPLQPRGKLEIVRFPKRKAGYHESIAPINRRLLRSCPEMLANICKGTSF